MKIKLITLILATFLSFSGKAQLNPINNLSFTHTYVMPYNCFSLSWELPELSVTDSLVGYNIYRNNDLYEFTTEMYHSCSPCFGLQVVPFCEFMNYNWGDFYIHVTAVYNSIHRESIYNDSVNFGGIMLGIGENPASRKLAIQDVFQGSSSLRIEFNEPVESGEMIISDLLGQKTQQLTIKNQKNVLIGTSGYPGGIYLLNIRTNKESLIRKLVLK